MRISTYFIQKNRNKNAPFPFISKAVEQPGRCYLSGLRHSTEAVPRNASPPFLISLLISVFLRTHAAAAARPNEAAAAARKTLCLYSPSNGRPHADRRSDKIINLIY